MKTKIEVVTMTPALAKAILEQLERQPWKEQDIIEFDGQGKLANGRHRLTAKATRK